MCARKFDQQFLEFRIEGPLRISYAPVNVLTFSNICKIQNLIHISFCHYCFSIIVYIKILLNTCKIYNIVL